MKASELYEAARAGRVSVLDDEYWDDKVQSDPSQIAYLVWNRNDVRVDGVPVKIIYNLDTQEDVGYGNHGNPLKTVFRLQGSNDVLIVMGEYDSWDNNNFPNGVQDAVLVNVPTWLPVGLTPPEQS